jgi:hypothetical protein
MVRVIGSGLQVEFRGGRTLCGWYGVLSLVFELAFMDGWSEVKI